MTLVFELKPPSKTMNWSFFVILHISVCFFLLQEVIGEISIRQQHDLANFSKTIVSL